jgi:hypothetical protein
LFRQFRTLPGWFAPFEGDEIRLDVSGAHLDQCEGRYNGSGGA